MRNRIDRRDLARMGLLSGVWIALSSAALRIAPAAAQEAKALSPAQPTNKPGFVAEIIECKRKDGVLTVRMRLRNTSDKTESLPIISGRNYDQYYVTAGGKKYLIIEDSQHIPLSAQADSFGNLTPRVPKGGAWVWWAKYPAPPPEEKTLSYYTPLTPPFDDVPISD